MGVEKINGCRTQVEVLSMENRELDGKMVHFALLNAPFPFFWKKIRGKHPTIQGTLQEEMTLGPSGNLVKLSSSPGVIAMKRVPSVGVPEVGYLHKQALRFTEGQHPSGGAGGRGTASGGTDGSSCSPSHPPSVRPSKPLSGGTNPSISGGD